MTPEPDIAHTLREILAEQKKITALLENGRQMQEENLRDLRERHEQDARVRDASVALQRAALDRFRKVSFVAIPLILLCIALIVWLMIRYRMF